MTTPNCVEEDRVPNITFSGDDLPAKYWGTKILAAHVGRTPMQDAEPENAATIVPKALADLPREQVPAKLDRLIFKTMVRAEAAENWIDWEERKIAALMKVDRAANKVVEDVSRRTYYLAMIDSATCGDDAPHTMQPLMLTNSAKSLPNPRHPYFQGRGLMMWLRETGGLKDPKSVWYEAGKNAGSPLFLLHPFGEHQYLGYFEGIKDEFDGIAHQDHRSPSSPPPRETPSYYDFGS